MLARGFALVRDAAGKPVLRAAAVQPGASLGIEFTDGSIGATAEGGARAKRPRAAAVRRAAVSKDQGSLW